jgi:hypothetical protein
MFYYIPYVISFSITSVVCDLLAGDLLETCWRLAGVLGYINISRSDLPGLLLRFFQRCIMGRNG